MSACPDPVVLRVLAEGGDLSESNARLAQHVAGCASCRELVELSRREEAVLRAQLGPLGQDDLPPGLHESMMRALDAVETPRRVASSRRLRVGPLRSRDSRPGAGGALALSLALLGAAGLALLFVRSTPEWRPETHETAPARDPGPAPRGPATPGEPAPPRSGSVSTPTATATPPAPREDETPDPAQIARAESPRPPAPEETTSPPQEPPRPDQGPATGPATGPAPLPAPSTEAPRPEGPATLLASVRSGKLSTGGRTLGAGDAVPEGAALEVASTAEVESEGAARLVLASGSRLSVRKGDAGEPVFLVAEGKALAAAAGSKPFAVASSDVRAVAAHGARFLFSVEPERTRVSTLEGRVSAAVEKLPPASALALDVRAGFEAEVAKGKTPEAPRPFAAARAVAWLPESARPKTLPAAPRVLASYGFEDGEGWTTGSIVAGGARGSKRALRGVAGTEGTTVELADERASSLEVGPGLWVELACKVDRAAVVAVELRGKRPARGPGFPGREDPLLYSLRQRVEAGSWVSIAAPLRDFTAGPPMGPGGAPPGEPGRGGRHGGGGAGGGGGGGVRGDERMARFVVRAFAKGESVDLLVDDVRFAVDE